MANYIEKLANYTKICDCLKLKPTQISLNVVALDVITLIKI